MFYILHFLTQKTIIRRMTWDDLAILTTQIIFENR
jgi:hypothetical protein